VCVTGFLLFRPLAGSQSVCDSELQGVLRGECA
jgi:hypothetical protein